MLQQIAFDYAEYVKQADVLKEINPLCTSLEDMLARLEEFESTLSSANYDVSITNNATLTQIISLTDQFEDLCKRIDKLEKFTEIVDKNLSNLERVVTVAEEELQIPDNSIKGFLKPLFGKSKHLTQTNIKNNEFVRPEIFKTSDYFPQTNL